ncbi:MAG: bifunctional pyr operon transcriptional regulator/uracil phosphoribosyltransferase PyrR [Chloroflexi bacterium]|nr:bifunctional pyr operon transcriptional regulator/uracil phosphoribosyltransferase PyrR [Chloroflexota bacterium]
MREHPAPPSAPDGRPSSLLLDAPGVRRTITRMAHEIAERNEGVEGVVLAGVHRRGVPLARRLAGEIEGFEHVRPLTGSLDVTMHRDDFAARGLRNTPRESALPDVEGRVVVLVDDVLYTGRTVRAALDALTDFGRPRAVRLAVLVDRGHRELPIRADIVGKNIPTARGDSVRVLLQEEDGRDAVLVLSGRSER